MTARLLVALAVLVLLAPACGDGDGGGTEAGTEPAETSGPPPAVTETSGTTSPDAETETETEPAGSQTYEVWLADRGFLRLGWRPGPETEAVARTALDLLLAEQSLTAVPAGTDLLGIDLAGDRARVDLSAEFGRSGKRLRVGQVVYTVTQFEGVGSAEILVNGEPLEDLPGAHTRAEFEDDLAPVIVESPTGLEPVTAPLVVSGTANTFEANVLITVLGDLGQELASTFATATCGSGCRGEFEKTVRVNVPAEQAVTLVVGEEDVSGGEGRPPYSVEIPLLLRP